MGGNWKLKIPSNHFQPKSKLCVLFGPTLEKEKVEKGFILKTLLLGLWTCAHHPAQPDLYMRTCHTRICGVVGPISCFFDFIFRSEYYVLFVEINIMFFSLRFVKLFLFVLQLVNLFPSILRMVKLFSSVLWMINLFPSVLQFVKIRDYHRTN